MKALDFFTCFDEAAGKPGLEFKYEKNDFSMSGWKLFLGPNRIERGKVKFSIAIGSSWYAFSALDEDAAAEDVAEDMLSRITQRPDEPIIIKVVSAVTGAVIISALWQTYNETAAALEARR